MSKEESAPQILTCSDETFRLYSTLCAGAKDGKDQENNRKKIKQKFEFSSRTPAFFLAVAIGIVNDRTGIVKKDKELTRREYIVEHANYGPFMQLLKSRYDLKTEFEIVNKLLEFQEYGIRELYSEYHKTGRIDFLRIFINTKMRL